ncbi:hypothetical protein JRO89_XS13G0104600 [Xanthoceras sorbifolium]|uniref:Glycosyltransferase n=1 Tax=Xanthoceras sorbifolium TaxID=99658 RepID=A0ABQ8H7L6_9ROSI|nr:hypothetical protein JRO89_XS13G0104600 [Xanthoceras sorbifolium]
MKRRAELIFVPLPGTSHLVPTLDFAKRLIDRDDRISITILVMKLPFGGGGAASTKSLAASHPSRIRFIDIPDNLVELPPPQLMMTSPEYYFSLFAESHIPLVRDIVGDIMSSQSEADSAQVSGLVVDLGFVSMIDVAIELGLPSYLFIASNFGFLSLLSYVLTHHDQVGAELEPSDSDKLVTIPGFVNPVPVSILPSGLFNKFGYTLFVDTAQRLKDAQGVIVNTFLELEQHAINTFSGGSNIPVYTVGPILDLQVRPNNSDSEESPSRKILEWLDDQPESSVVFLCFGTGGKFSPAQVKEIATGLEKSEFRFLWSLQFSPQKNVSSDCSTNGGDVLPEGFLERSKERGMICGWAPQVEVLAHKAIGGFVSHCGWNSVLESLWHGVPIVTWPLYAEQQFNAFMLVKELGLSVELRLDSKMDDDLVVTADEIARAVRYLMDGDSEIRKKVKQISEIGRKSHMDGGSSFISTGKFIDLNF